MSVTCTRVLSRNHTIPGVDDTVGAIIITSGSSIVRPVLLDPNAEVAYLSVAAKLCLLDSPPTGNMTNCTLFVGFCESYENRYGTSTATAAGVMVGGSVYGGTYTAFSAAGGPAVTGTTTDFRGTVSAEIRTSGSPDVAGGNSSCRISRYETEFTSSYPYYAYAGNPFGYLAGCHGWWAYGTQWAAGGCSMQSQGIGHSKEEHRVAVDVGFEQRPDIMLRGSAYSPNAYLLSMGCPSALGVSPVEFNNNTAPLCKNVNIYWGSKTQTDCKLMISGLTIGVVYKT